MLLLLASVTRPRSGAILKLVLGLLALATPFAGALQAASSPTIDNLISKLPDPSQWSQSPLETALKDPDPIFQDPAFLQLVVSLKGRDPKGALESLRALALKYPQRHGVEYLRGSFALRLRLYAEAEESFRTLTSDKRVAPLGWFGIALAQLGERRPVEAFASLHQAVALKPDFVNAWVLLAVSEIKQGQLRQAAEAALHVTKLKPQMAMGWGILGFCDAAAHNYADAVFSYTKALLADHYYIFAYDGLGICLVEMNRPADAVQPLKAAVTLAPRDYLAATELGYCYLRAGQAADAVKSCQQALKSNPRFSKAWDLLGLSYKQEGKTRQAVDAFQRAVQADAANGSARAHLTAALQPPQAATSQPPRS